MARDRCSVDVAISRAVGVMFAVALAVLPSTRAKNCQLGAAGLRRRSLLRLCASFKINTGSAIISTGTELFDSRGTMGLSSGR